MGSSKESSLFVHPNLYDNREECIMDTLNSELWNLTVLVLLLRNWILNIKQFKNKQQQKQKTTTKSGEKDSKESQQANSKMGDFGKKKKIQNVLEKTNEHKGKKEIKEKNRKKKKERNEQTKNKAQNFLQSTQTKSKHPSLTW